MKANRVDNKTNENVSRYNVTEDMKYSLVFQFQNNYFRFMDAVHILGNNTEVEIFPGIYFKEEGLSTVFSFKNLRML